MLTPASHYNLYSLDLDRKLRYWYGQSKLWNTIHWVASFIALALFAFSTGALLCDSYHKFIATAAIIVIGFIALTNPSTRAARFRRAYLILDPALRDYRAKIIDSRTLKQVYRQAEEALHDIGLTPLFTSTTSHSNTPPPASNFTSTTSHTNTPPPAPNASNPGTSAST